MVLGVIKVCSLACRSGPGNGVLRLAKASPECLSSVGVEVDSARGGMVTSVGSSLGEVVLCSEAAATWSIRSRRASAFPASSVNHDMIRNYPILVMRGLNLYKRYARGQNLILLIMMGGVNPSLSGPGLQVQNGYTRLLEHTTEQTDW